MTKRAEPTDIADAETHASMRRVPGRDVNPCESHGAW